MKKVPDMIDTFESRLNTLMAEKHHGVLLTGITLMIEMCLVSPDILNRVRAVHFVFDPSHLVLLYSCKD